MAVGMPDAGYGRSVRDTSLDASDAHDAISLTNAHLSLDAIGWFRLYYTKGLGNNSCTKQDIIN
jgi:hypothetical protein